MATIWIEAGDQTGELVDYLTSQVDDNTLDSIDVKRQIAPVSGLASEPVTVAVTLTLSTATVIVVARVIERWLENQRQAQAMKAVVDGFDKSEAAGKALAGLASKHAQISLSYGLPPVE